MDSMSSEGIVFKRPKNAPSKLRDNGKRKRPANDGVTESLDPALDVFRTYEEPSETISRRLELYEQNLEFLQNSLQKTQDRFNTDLKTRLLNFVRSSFKTIERIESVIPIGILESSLSVGENVSIFNFIEEQLKQLSGEVDDKVFVSRVQSGTTSSTKAMFQKICCQICNVEEPYIEDEDSEELSPAKKSQGTRKRPHYNLYDVKEYLGKLTETYKLVIIVEDVEYFSSPIITQILTLLGSAGLPIIFIFGVTHGHFVQNLIPLNSSSEYILDKFYSVTPKERFNDFLRRILFDPKNMFRVSGPIVSYLESQYTEDNFSVEHTSNSLKFCLRYHFLSAKSAFCSSCKADAYVENELQRFKESLETLNLTEGTSRKKVKVCAGTSEQLLDTTVEAMKGWLFYLRLLCFLNLRLPDMPLGDSHAKIYVSCYEGYTTAKESSEEEPFYRFFKTLGSLSKTDLREILEECVEFLKNGCLPDTEWAQDVLLHFEQLLTSLIEGEQQSKANVEGNDEAKNKPMKLRKLKNIKDLQQSLLDHKRQTDGESAAYTVRSEFIVLLRKLLKKFFPPLSTLKYSEIFVFADLNQLINAIYPANFLQLNEDITSPGYVLQCECCSDIEPSSIDANLPDVTIIHKLFSEHTTKKVDLNLIYHAFVSVVQPPVSTVGRKSKASNSKELAATASYLKRFRRAVGELQHMGFVKRSKSKPDEVSRLTWW